MNPPESPPPERKEAPFAATPQTDSGRINTPAAAENQAGSLRKVIGDACADSGYGMSELTVLAPQNDPYRHDTPAGHRDAAWFLAVVDRFLGPSRTVHLRGLHYLISSAGDVIKPNGKGYINSDENWEWLCIHAAKAARWLGYVPFARIVDERNAPAEIYVPELGIPTVSLSEGEGVSMPFSLEDAMPRLTTVDIFEARQAFRIILIGEKTSLKAALQPIAQMVGGELLLPTGELSDTMIAEMSARAASDGRQAVVLYFSDFDPSGRQMAVSAARKIQALRDLLHPDLDLQLHPVALTLDQVRRLDLPSTPLKETERRGDKWQRVMGHAQTEIDALIALHPRELRSIALEAIEPFFDRTLQRRVSEAADNWEEQAREDLETHPAYELASAEVDLALDGLRVAAATFRDAQEAAMESLRGISYPEIVVPEPGLDAEPPAPLFTTDDDYATASRRLIAHKALENN